MHVNGICPESGVGEGLGLGLAICRTVVENHEGKLRLAKSDCHGSIFEVVMPIGT